MKHKLLSVISSCARGDTGRNVVLNVHIGHIRSVRDGEDGADQVTVNSSSQALPPTETGKAAPTRTTDVNVVGSSPV